MARKKTGRNPKSFSEAVGFRNKYQSDTTDFFLGFFLLAVAVYVVIAMVSYLSTGQADQSTLENMRPGEILNSNHEFTNYCGSVGALLSYHAELRYSGFPYSRVHHTGGAEADESLLCKPAEMVFRHSSCHGMGLHYLCKIPDACHERADI